MCLNQCEIMCINIMMCITSKGRIVLHKVSISYDLYWPHVQCFKLAAIAVCKAFRDRCSSSNCPLIFTMAPFSERTSSPSSTTSSVRVLAKEQKTTSKHSWTSWMIVYTDPHTSAVSPVMRIAKVWEMGWLAGLQGKRKFGVSLSKNRLRWTRPEDHPRW